MNKTSATKKTLRTFTSINIEFQKRQLNNLKNLKTELKNEEIKWVSPKNHHITLRFLGETPLVQIEGVKTSLLEVLKLFSPFHLDLLQLHCFENHGKPKVIIVNTADSEIMNNLASSIYLQLEKIGFGKEIRSYHPHLTLGRINSLKDKNHFYDVIDKLSHSFYQTVDVKAFTFYQSLLYPNGPVYKSIQTFNFSNS